MTSQETYAAKADTLRSLADEIDRSRREYDSGEALNLAVHVRFLCHTLAGLADALAANAPDAKQPGAEPFTARYAIPGTFTATYRGTLDGGEIIGLHFTPAEGAAGYFGPRTECSDDPQDVEEDAYGLDVGDAGSGPFWSAVQRALEDIGEQPKSPENPHTIHRVPIEWAEDGPPRL